MTEVRKTATPGMIVFIILMVTLAGIGQLFIKHGVTEVTEQLGGFPSDIVGFIRLIFHWQVFLGLVIYFFFGVAWLKILADVPVSFAFPFLAISYIVIILGSWKFLGENISTLKIISIVLIILGVVSLSRSDTSEHRESPAKPAPSTSSDL
jgi:drug/metabolite transporter (DMT)-like permease